MKELFIMLRNVLLSLLQIRTQLVSYEIAITILTGTLIICYLKITQKLHLLKKRINLHFQSKYKFLNLIIINNITI